MIFATLLRIMAGSKQPFDTVGPNSKMILSFFFPPSFPISFPEPSRTRILPFIYIHIYISFLSLSSNFGRVVFPFYLFLFSLSPSLFGQPTPATAGTAIYTRPADSEAVRRNKSRLLYKCCQQNRNIAFAYQLFAVQFTRASGGRQKRGLGTAATGNPEGEGEGWRRFWAGWVGAYNTRWGAQLIVHVANKLTTAAGRRHLYYDLSQLPARCLLPPPQNAAAASSLLPRLLLAQSKYFHPYILKMSGGRFMVRDGGREPVPRFRLLAGLLRDTN